MMTKLQFDQEIAELITVLYHPDHHEWARYEVYTDAQRKLFYKYIQHQAKGRAGMAEEPKTLTFDLEVWSNFFRRWAEKVPQPLPPVIVIGNPQPEEA